MQTEDRVRTAAGTQDDQAVGLLREVARGDRSAMTQLYALFEGPVYRFALARLKDAAAAGDVLNETLLHVWQEAGRFRGPSKVLTWVLGIAAHLAAERVRPPTAPQVEQQQATLSDEGSTDMARILGRMDDLRVVRDAVRRLDVVQRSALHLAFHEDLSYGEMAEVLGCPEGTAKARVFDAKQALKRLLAA